MLAVRWVSFAVCLVLAGACTKAEFEPDGSATGTGGTIPLVDTGVDEGTGGAGEDAGEDLGGSEVDAGPDLADDGGPIDMAPDLAPGADAADASDGPDVSHDGPIVITPTMPGQILITEVMYDPIAVPDDYSEWFEVFNPSTEVTYSLLGCGVSDDSPSHTQIVSKSVVLPPRSYRTFALTSPGGLPTDNPGFVPDYFYMVVKFDSDVADRVTLTCSGMVIDQFAYIVPTPKESGRAFSVDPNHLTYAEHNLPGNFCRAQTTLRTTAVGTDYGTPGMENPPCPPAM